MKGRKPQPQSLKILRGVEPRYLNPDAPQAPPARPFKSAYLDGIAGEEWDRIVPQLESLGVLASVDASALEVYCHAYERWHHATAEVRKNLFVKSASGVIKANPAIAIAQRAEASMAKYLTEFGATPSSRSRVKTQTVVKDELSEFLGRKRG